MDPLAVLLHNLVELQNLHGLLLAGRLAGLLCPLLPRSASAPVGKEALPTLGGRERSKQLRPTPSVASSWLAQKGSPTLSGNTGAC